MGRLDLNTERLIFTDDISVWFPIGVCGGRGGRRQKNFGCGNGQSNAFNAAYDEPNGAINESRGPWLGPLLVISLSD